MCDSLTMKGKPCLNRAASGCTIMINKMVYRLCPLHYGLFGSGHLAALNHTRGRRADRWAKVGDVFINLDTYEEVEQLKFDLNQEGEMQ